MGNSGSVSSSLKKWKFKLKPEGLNMERPRLELIDFGLGRIRRKARLKRRRNISHPRWLY